MTIKCILLVYFISLTVCAISCIPLLMSLFKMYRKEGQSIKIMLGIVICVIFSVIPVLNILITFSNINDMKSVITKRNKN